MKYLSLASVLTLVAAPVLASDLASGPEIEAAISGNTVQGSMIDAGAYTEFYDSDGTIKGDGYAGTWSVTENTMCFDYGEGADCWAVRIEGDMVAWIKDGEEDGTGTIVPGNPNEY